MTIVPVSIPLWFDYNHLKYPFYLGEWSFGLNSTMVRLQRCKVSEDDVQNCEISIPLWFDYNKKEK